jgi:hypothetical protein
MSLLLNGAKTLTIAGTEMQCLEIYTGEAYTFPFTFTDSGGNPINCTGWTLGIGAKFYTSDTVTYSATGTEVILGNLSLNSPQPTSSGYSDLAAAFTTPATGIGYIYVPAEITGGFGSPNPTPIITLANSGANSTLVIVTMSVTRNNVLSGENDINREPIGLIVRYQ